MTDSWMKLFVDLLPGLALSLGLTASLLAVGLPLGLLFAIGLGQKSRILRGTAIAVVEFARGVPALILLYLVYFGFPEFGVIIDSFPAAAIALGFSFAGYVSEVFRSGLEAVGKGQHEAAAALGLSSWTAFSKVVLPQAVKIVIPPLLGWSISYFQATSLAFAIAVPELMSRAYVLATTNFAYLLILSLAALLYAIVSIPLANLAERLSRGRQLRRNPTSVPLASIKEGSTHA
ncbi:amino acid ABC transporter permease [Paenarthrobacter sp. NPDC089989]|uniref:amino acid ABC transporter permease n=1 Tax=unclassified Paenarthrobacter TaxID=2634190 RepID=UPI0037FCA51E